MIENNGKQRVALYARVSTEDQAERHTVQGQLDFLRSFCGLYSLPVASEYVDDGVSGTVPLENRPEGRRLLEAARAGQFSTVLVYKLDRLGRKLGVILHAHDQLEGLGVTVRSGTEPIDTSTPIGKFIFQLLASLAELERETITERMLLGRNRVAKAGKWTGGPVPFGYDLDADGCLVPSERIVPGLGVTEADAVRDIYRRTAGGGTATGEARRLNAAGAPCVRRYAGRVVEVAPEWGISRMTGMLKNPLYKGLCTINGKGGPVERPVPALVTPELWEAAVAQLRRNTVAGHKNALRAHPLRGLVACGNCGRAYSGQTDRRAGRDHSYYRCTGVTNPASPNGRRCLGKRVSAEWLEEFVWAQCRNFILNPGEPLEEDKRELRARMEQTAGVEGQRRALAAQIADKEGERERMMTLFRRGRASLAETESQLDAIDRETAALREMADAMRSQAELTAAYEAQIASAGAVLIQLRGKLAEIEEDAASDYPERRGAASAKKREVVDLLVSRITVTTSGKRRSKSAEVRVRYAFGQPTVAAYSTRMPSRKAVEMKTSCSCLTWRSGDYPPAGQLTIRPTTTSSTSASRGASCTTMPRRG